MGRITLKVLPIDSIDYALELVNGRVLISVWKQGKEQCGAFYAQNENGLWCFCCPYGNDQNLLDTDAYDEAEFRLLSEIDKSNTSIP